MKKTIATIENKVTGTVITQTLSDNEIISINVESKFDNSKVYNKPKNESSLFNESTNQINDLFEYFNEIFSPKNLQDGQ